MNIRAEIGRKNWVCRVPRFEVTRSGSSNECDADRSDTYEFLLVIDPFGVKKK